jgi:hypothetical protein
MLEVDVSEHCIGSIFIGAEGEDGEDGTDTVFRNAGF